MSNTVFLTLDCCFACEQTHKVMLICFLFLETIHVDPNWIIVCEGTRKTSWFKICAFFYFSFLKILLYEYYIFHNKKNFKHVFIIVLVLISFGTKIHIWNKHTIFKFCDQTTLNLHVQAIQCYLTK